ncbi:peptide/nickel transport system permease protein [Desulfotomaculum arcticum]|uniref:Peptide/nickel transport system permease protein n=1 Tax=Desulfotruncus arcticus DSM 17038 TaxID=1121424 RepID=A0A1I2TKI4_9FIRM|nr:ABC transporter permease [Desulfotruncus arcticus]SFG65323.1 peptide/nickel transport system permease protein [Desulfotomaculum arcticum] [Desulfotruncus arcticus DSM 17038]
MLNYIIKRLLMIVPVIIGVSILSFMLIHLVPGDPARMMLGERATPKAMEELRETLGLNDPLPVQYLRFANHALHGDLGGSIRSKLPVTEEMASKFPATLELAFFAMLIAVIVGGLAGIISSVKPYSFFDNISMGAALFGVSIPIFWLGLMMIWFFGVNLHILPPSGRISVGVELHKITNMYLLDSIITGNWKAFKDVLAHIIMPSIALSTIPMAMVARVTRSSMMEVLGQDYIRTAWAKGLPGRLVIFRHALKNAFLPVLTVIGLQFGYLLGGAVMTEAIFSWPGVGRWLFVAISARDIPIVQGGILMVALVFVIINLIVDILYTYVDPRIRLD